MWRAGCESPNPPPIWPWPQLWFPREDVAIPAETVLFGEISLSGALRPVGQTENRLKEAAKLGFSQAIAPNGSKLGQVEGMTVRQMPDLTAFVGEMFGAG